MFRCKYVVPSYAEQQTWGVNFNEETNKMGWISYRLIDLMHITQNLARIK